MFQRYQMCHAKVWRREKKKKRVDPKKTLRHVLSRLHTAPCSRHVFFFFFIHCCRAVFGSIASSSGSKRHKQRWRIIVSEKWQQSATGDWSEKPLAATQWCHSSTYIIRTQTQQSQMAEQYDKQVRQIYSRSPQKINSCGFSTHFYSFWLHFFLFYSLYSLYLLRIYIWINKK